MNHSFFQQQFERLNSDQKKAVTTFDGPVLVVAGPGTGKTQVLTMRIAYILLHEEIKPQNILALTFTESGVFAMKERLIQLIGSTGYYVQIKTFHSFCNDIILEFPDKFSYKTKDFTNLTDIERFKLIRELIDILPLQHLKSFRETYFYVSEILNAIKDLKKEGITPIHFQKIVEMYEEQANNDPSLLNKNGTQGERYRKEMKKVEKNKELVLLYDAYQKKLEALGRYDYEDMIMFVVQKLKDDEELLRTLQERYHHFLVDEYQDTNGAQNFVVYQLANYFENPNLFVVGDDDQSIYRFQGASLENMLYLNDKFTNITTVVLHTNYRSTQGIIDASTSVIQKNEDRITNPIYGFHIDKMFQAHNTKELDKVSLYEFSSGDIENYFLAEQIESLLSHGVNPHEIAIIYRNNRDVIDIINLFQRKNIPWVMEGGFDILRDNEIAKIIEIFQVVVDPLRSDLLFRVLHHESFRLPAFDLMKLSRIFYNHKNTEKEMIDIILDDKKLAENDISSAKIISEIGYKIILLQKESKTLVLADLVEKILRELGVLDYFLNLNHLKTINRINSLFTFIKKENYKNHKLTLSQILVDIDMMIQEGIAIPELLMEMLDSGVHLMTAHKSKGLEFEYVFLTKCIDGKWGNQKKRSILQLPPNILEEQKIAEIVQDEDERRLFYVALTRAKKRAIITYARTYPLLNKMATVRSQFISEIDPQFFVQEDATDYEKKSGEILKLLFVEDVHDMEKETKQYLEGLVSKYRINPVALGTYVTCPRKFEYDHLIRVPRAKSKLQVFGTAMHAALEDFFKEYKREKKVPPLDFLLASYEEAAFRDLMSDQERNESLQEGKKILSAYYKFYEEKFEEPLYLERDYNRIQVYFEDIPLSGKIDKIEKISISGDVRVVDYKTGRARSENDIKGVTQSSGGNKGYYYQLLFYKLLIDLDKDIHANVLEGMLDFVHMDNDGTGFKQLVIPFETEEFEEFKKVLKEVYSHIKNLEFPKTTILKECEDCVYRKICWKDTLF